MKTQDIALLGVAAYLLLSKSSPFTYDVQKNEKQRWTEFPTIVNNPALVYQNPLTANIPAQALIKQAIGVQSWADIPTTEEFKVYSVNKGNYTEYYYTL